MQGILHYYIRSLVPVIRPRGIRSLSILTAPETAYNILEFSINILHLCRSTFPLADKDKIVSFIKHAWFVHFIKQFSQGFPVKSPDAVSCNCNACLFADGKADSIGMGFILTNKQYEVPAGKPSPSGKDFSEFVWFY